MNNEALLSLQVLGEILMLAGFFVYEKNFDCYNKHDIQLSC